MFAAGHDHPAPRWQWRAVPRVRLPAGTPFEDSTNYRTAAET
jgi:hypothetical protein